MEVRRSVSELRTALLRAAAVSTASQACSHELAWRVAVSDWDRSWSRDARKEAAGEFRACLEVERRRERGGMNVGSEEAAGACRAGREVSRLGAARHTSGTCRVGVKG